MTEKQQIICGNFNLQDFVISSGREFNHDQTMQDKIMDNESLKLEQNEIYSLRQSYTQKYPVLNSNFLSLTIAKTGVPMPGGMIMLPKFSIYSFKQFDFSLFLKYETNQRYPTIRAYLEAYWENSHKNIPATLEHKIISGLQGFEMIKFDGHATGYTLSFTKKEREHVWARFGKEDKHMKYQTTLSTLVDANTKNKIKIAQTVFGKDQVYIISMNEEYSYGWRNENEQLLSRKSDKIPSDNERNDRKNLLVTAYGGSNLHLISTFDVKSAEDMIQNG